MSLYDYRGSLELSGHDYGFCSLIMSAMRKADSINIEKLKAAFPLIFEELQKRYHAPGGLIDGEKTTESNGE